MQYYEERSIIDTNLRMPTINTIKRWRRRRTLWKWWPTMAVRWDGYGGLWQWQDHVKHARLTKKHQWANGYRKQNDDRTKPNGMPPCHHIIDLIAIQCLQQLKQYQQDYSCIPGYVLHLCKNWSIEKGKAVSNKQWHRGWWPDEHRQCHKMPNRKEN